MTQLLVRFDDFSGGDRGLATGRHAARNTYSGWNVVPTRSRGITTRRGFMALRFSPGAFSGGFSDIGWYNAGRGGYGTIWFVDKDGRWRYGDMLPDPTDTLTMTAYTGAAYGDDLGGIVDHVNVDTGLSYIVDSSQGVTKLDHNAHTVNRLAGSPQGRCIALHNDFMFVGGGAGNQKRVRYSKVADYDTWPSGNYFDLPHEAGIVSLIPQRDSLIIVQEDATVWAYYGVPAANATLRRITGPVDNISARGKLGSTTGYDANRWNVSGSGTIWGEIYGVPTRMNGFRLEPFELMGNLLDVGATSIALPSTYPDEMVWIASAGADLIVALSWDGRGFSRHYMTAGGAGPIPLGTVGLRGQLGPGFVIAATGDDLNALVWSHRNDDGPWQTLYAFDYAGESVSTDLWCPDYDDDGGSTKYPVIGEFETSQAGSDRGYHMKPRHVVVNYTAYQTTQSLVDDHDARETNTFDVTLRAYDTGPWQDGTDPIDAGPLTHSEPCIAATAPERRPQHRRVQFSFDEIACQSFSVKITNMRGVRIDSIEVYGDAEPPKLP